MLLIKPRLPRRTFLRSLGAAISVPVFHQFLPVRAALAQTPAAPSWHLTATVAESCSCAVSCPCNFGSSPTHMPCHGNRLIAIKSGHYQDVDLSGVAFLVTFMMRDWSKIYVSDRVSSSQMAAVEALLPIAFAGFHKGMLSLTKAPLKMYIGEKRVTYSVPESSVDMEMMRGFDGKPVKVLNLPNPAYQDYTQYRSIVLRHESADQRFTYSGTTGFTSIMDVGSKP